MTARDLGIEGISDPAEIGRGGFGVVYRALEADLGRTVAVKVIHGVADEAARKRFDRERKAMGALSHHPSIVTVHRSGFTAGGDPYLVMEYLEAGSLAEVLATGGRLPWERVRRIGIDIAEALSSAHRSGVLHRDIKPGNIMVSADGTPKLGDFGIARLHSAPETRSAVVTASVAHAPPEVLAGTRPDARADLYSLASTLFELAWGVPPFSRSGEESLLPMLNRIATMPMPALDAVGVPADAQALLARAMAKDPADRHPDLAAFAEDLRRLPAAGSTPSLAEPVTGPIAAASPAPPAQPAPPVQPAPMPVATPTPLVEPTPASSGNGLSNTALGAIAAALAVVVAVGAIVAFGGGDDGEPVAAEGTSSTTEIVETVASTTTTTTPPETSTTTTTTAPPETTSTTNLAQGPDRFIATTDGAVSALVPAAWTVTESSLDGFGATAPLDSVEDPDTWIPGMIVLYFASANGYEPTGINQNLLMDDVMADTACEERERHYYDDGAGLTGTYLIADSCGGVWGQSLYLVAATAADESFTTAIAIAYPTDDDSVVFSILDSLEYP